MSAAKRIYFLDTNIFLRLLVKEDEQTFGECRLLLQMVKDNQIEAATSSLVLAEIGWTLKSFYKLPKKKIVAMLRSIIHLRGLKMVDDYEPALALRFFLRFNIKLIDAFIAAIEPVAEKKWVVVSYDRDFRKLPILSQTPAAVLKKAGTGKVKSLSKK